MQSNDARKSVDWNAYDYNDGFRTRKERKDC